MIALERTIDAFKRYGVKKTKGYELIHNGLFPAPIKPNERPSRVPVEEVDIVISATIAGYSSAELQFLVASLQKKRVSSVDTLRIEALVQDRLLQTDTTVNSGKA